MVAATACWVDNRSNNKRTRDYAFLPHVVDVYSRLASSKTLGAGQDDILPRQHLPALRDHLSPNRASLPKFDADG